METPYFLLGVLGVSSLLAGAICWIVWSLKLKKNRAKPKPQPISEPESSEVHNARGNLYAHEKKYEDAKTEYGKALKIDPKFAKAHNNLGNVYFKQGLMEEAEWKYKKALELSPQYCDAHFNLGILFKRQEKLDDAILKFHEVLQLSPKDELAKKYIESIKKKIDAKK
jgi:tetratricopeptide (TPR) repeat protein